MLPDLNRLNVFFHVFQCQSIKNAAEKLCLTQPGVSQHIKKLEQEIKTLLFVRQHKKIIPTRAAHRLFRQVEPFITGLDETIQHISRPTNQPYGRLRIGAPLEFGKTYLPGICSRFRQKWPEVMFKIRLEEPDQLLKMLNKGAVDLAVIDYFSAKDQLLGRPETVIRHPLMEEIFVLACSRTYFDEKMNRDISYETLINQDYLTDEHDPVILRHWFWHYFKKSDAGLNIVMAIESHQALLNCIRLDMGLAITAYHLVKDEIDKGKIVALFPGKEKVVNQVSLVRLREKKPTITEKVFQSFLLDYFKKWVSQSPSWPAKNF